MKPASPTLALLLALASGAAMAADVGRVVLAAGDATALRDGQVIRLALGNTVQDRDVLRTGPASNLQVRFIDESYVALREGSEVRVDQFQFTGGKGGESAVFSLIEGGLRAVTGLIGRQNHDDYKMVTPTATIGIRGTDYAATYCQGDCTNPDGSRARDGTYGRVIGQSEGTNQIHVANEVDQRTLGINSNFFVGDRRSSVETLLSTPAFVLSKLEGRSRGGSKGSAGGTGEEKASSGGTAEESRPSTIPPPLPQVALVITPNVATTPVIASEVLTTQGTPAIVPPPTAPPPTALSPPTGFLVVFPGTLSLGGIAFFDDAGLTATYNSLNQITSVSGDGVSASLAGGSIVDSGSFSLPNGQVFVYGRWTGPTSVPLYNGSTFVQTTGAPLLFGTATGVVDTDIVGKLGGVVTYSYVGGPKPVDGGGNVGSITAANTTVNFTTLQQSYTLGMNFPSIMVGAINTGPAVFNLSGVGTPEINSGGEFFGQLNGTCSGSGCYLPTAIGYFGTGFTGPNGYDFAAVGGLVFGTQAGEVAFLNGHQATSYTPGPLPTVLTGQLAYAYPYPAYNAGGVFSLPTSSTVYSGVNPISFNAGSSFGSLGGGTIIDTGSTSLADGGTMNWGRWSGPTSITDPIIGTYSPASGVPFVVGSANVTLPTSGTFLYSYAGGPNPTDALGNVGTFSGGAFNVSFGATSGSFTVQSPLTLSVAGRGYSLTSCSGGCTFTNASTVAGNMVLNGICVGGACSTSSPATANAAGIFVGPQGAGLAVAGNITTAIASPPVTFAAGFKR